MHIQKPMKSYRANTNITEFPLLTKVNRIFLQPEFSMYVHKKVSNPNITEHTAAILYIRIQLLSLSRKLDKTPEFIFCEYIYI